MRKREKGKGKKKMISMNVHGSDRPGNMACRIRQTCLRDGGLRSGDGDGGAGLLPATERRWRRSPTSDVLTWH